uniref:ABC-1 domain containing protein n=2 Tax=Haemonchus contortus TaxID=6289 RepID=A0A7I4YEK7_HAECO
MLSLRLVGPLRAGSSFLARRSITTYVASPGRASIRLRLLAAASGAGLYTALHLKRVHCEALLEDPWLLTPHVNPILEKRSIIINFVYLPWYLICRSWILLRRITRCLALAIRFVPLAITYPLAYRVHSLHELWWAWVLYTIQSSGPTFIKLGQWASTRRDIFSKEFCDRMSILHTKTRRQRYFRDCDKVLDEVFGEGFVKNHKDDVFVRIEPYSIGSGCIAQVYKGTVNVDALERAIGKKFPQFNGYVEREVAIKVAENGVEEQINLDLSILRNATSLVLKLMPSLSYLEPLSALAQFEMVLRRQVDLRNEARALQRFSENFDHKKTGVKFPTVIGYTKNIIVETFEHGMYINRLVAEDNDPQLATRQSPKVRRRIALLGARALLKMIFVDNFVHGDLHPGNILIRFNEDDQGLPGVHNAPPKETIFEQLLEQIRNWLGWRTTPRVRFTDSPELADEPTLVMLDTGIVVSETEKNLRNLKALFRAILQKQGYKAGELLLSHAENSRNCRDPHEFCLQVDRLVEKAMKERSLRSLNISALLSEMFSLVAAHRVYLDSSFTSVVLSVMVLEGFGRSLDPDLDLFQCARPYLLNMV